MDNFLKQGIEAYRNQTARERKFVGYARRTRSLLQATGRASEDAFMVMLTPMIEVAWVDGRVGRVEQNAILRTAEIYGLLRDDENFVKIMTRLSSRPHSVMLENLWDHVADHLSGLPLGMTAAISSLLLAQTRYVADLGQKQIYGLWRGHASGKDEEINFVETQKRLSRFDTKEPLPSSEFPQTEIADHLKILPLVKVAWADGRITKRERQLIFDSLFDLGVDPNNDNLNQLLHWLELSPKEEFFQESLEKLRVGLETLDEEERAQKKYSLISQCTLVAEVSGGDSKFPAGGKRICDEEITAVKQIARILNGAVKQS